MSSRSFIYHSPLGDRELFTKESPKDGLVDLFNADGDLEIGSCRIGESQGECSPADKSTPEEGDKKTKK